MHDSTLAFQRLLLVPIFLLTWGQACAQQPATFYLRDAKHGKALVAGDVANNRVYHQDPSGRANAQWSFVPTGDGFYYIIDKKHGLALVAGDVANNNVYHQAPNGRKNAKWMVTFNASALGFVLTEPKHMRSLVGGDSYNGHVYHQPDGGRLNAVWRLQVAVEGSRPPFFPADPAPVAVISQGAETPVAATSTQPVAPAAPSMSAGIDVNKTFQMKFHNDGDLPVKLFRSTATALGEPLSLIRGTSWVHVQVKYGDQFEVILWDELKDERATGEGRHPKVYISGDKPGTIVLHGRRTFQDFRKGNPLTRKPDYDFNVTGLDIRSLDLSNLPKGLSKTKEIFQRFEPDSLDYVPMAGNAYVKFGFNLSEAVTGLDTQGVHVTTAFSNFSQQINAKLGGSYKGVSGGLAFSRSFSENQKSGQVYAFSRKQAASYGVTVDPIEARLETRFKEAVKGIANTNDAQRFIEIYGTHYVRSMTYGEDRLSFVVMTSSEYSKANTFGVDVGLAIKKSEEGVTEKTKKAGIVTEEKIGSSQVASGELSFGFQQSQESGNTLSDKKGTTRWFGTPSDPAPIGIDADVIYNLVTPQIFKDGTDPAFLAQKRSILKSVVDQILSRLPNQGAPLPEARLYSVRMESLEIVEELDDANKAMKGKVTVTLPDGAVQVLWEEPRFKRELEFRQGLRHRLPTAKRTFFLVRPNNQGQFPAATIQAVAKIHEYDDLIWDNEDVMDGTSGALSVRPGAYQFDATYYAFAHNNRVRIHLEIKEEPLSFAELAK